MQIQGWIVFNEKGVKRAIRGKSWKGPKVKEGEYRVRVAFEVPDMLFTKEAPLLQLDLSKPKAGWEKVHAPS